MLLTYVTKENQIVRALLIQRNGLRRQTIHATQEKSSDAVRSFVPFGSVWPTFVHVFQKVIAKEDAKSGRKNHI